MNEYFYIMTLSNYGEGNDLHLENQKLLFDNVTDELVIDIITSINNETYEFDKMVNQLKEGDIVKIAKLSVLGPNITSIVQKYKSIISKKANLKIYNMSIMNDLDNWIDILQTIEDDRLYYNRCIGHLKSIKNRPEYALNRPGKPKKYSNKQLNDALALRDKFTFLEISNMTGISVSSLKRASNKFKEH